MKIILIGLTLTAVMFSCNSNSEKESNNLEKSITSKDKLNNTKTNWEKFQNSEIKTINGDLTINNVSEKDFSFIINSNNGSNIGTIEGKAIIKDAYNSIYQEDECNLTFKITNDSIIQVNEGGNCNKGIGVSYSGNYTKNNSESLTEEKHPLVKKEVLPNISMEEQFKALTSTEYNRFIETFEDIIEQDNSDKFEATCFTGMIPGLGTINEGIIMYTKDGKIWAGIINDNKIKYFTNQQEFSNQMPETLKVWYERLNDKELIYMNKK
jgi:hypothetical protein